MMDSHRRGFGPSGVIFCAFFTFAAIGWAGTYSGGSGTVADPFQIASAQDLIELGQTLDDYRDTAYFILTADIDLSDYTFSQAVIAPFVYNEEEETYDGLNFDGRFNGNGHTISHLTILTQTAAGNLGLFGELGGDAVVENLRLEHISISHIDKANFVGGLCGLNNTGWIQGCSVSGTVNGNRYVGGLCGYNYYGTITRCESSSAVQGQTFVGGLCGYNTYTSERCFATGMVNGGDGSVYLGGLCGLNNGPLVDCYAKGSVTCGDDSLYVGGLAGSNNGGTVTRCYSTGALMRGQGGNYFGGLCGENNLGTVSDCFWDTQTSHMTSSSGGTGKTTAEKKTLST